MRLWSGVIMLFWGLPSVQAMTMLPVPTEPIYAEPPIVKAKPAHQQFDCYELDAAINALHPFQYSYKPDFYSDSSNKVATGLIIFDNIPIFKAWLGLGYLGYSSLVTENEVRRMENVRQQIAMLQRLKAEKRCFQ
ncbi:hypothetical protein Q7C_1019 [Methylophaga frappieri]|uniref:Uncharacterized protein n=1 Tax=Methylophaga frappieri (strain ATCC BAA-2434 / DSM 25690 / JAM7) TaxID=754477 RepID=I1YGY8_METFJ|nr:hypothetical protein [Methylophaga frappieri]AFJ02181.1 hypothetical protein Q7C_1019 [Methylophaga frappieri]